MRITAGKIYFWGATSIAVLTLWNRFSTRNLRTVVDNMKEERMREADQLRAQNARHGTTTELTPEQRQQQLMAERGFPAFFNPYYEQQQRENASIRGSE